MINGRKKKLVGGPQFGRNQIAAAMQRVENIQNPQLRAVAQARVRDLISRARSAGTTGPIRPNFKAGEVEQRQGGSGRRPYAPSWS